MAEDRLCPICRRIIADSPEAVRFRPFCSKRCADVDLGRWLKGSYGIPATETDDESEAEGEKPDEESGDAGPAGRGPRVRH